jgi:hypothetical protein
VGVELQAIGELRTDNDLEQFNHVLDRFGHGSDRVKGIRDWHDALSGDEAVGS